MVSSPPPMGLHCFTPRLSQACSLPVSAQHRLSLVAPYHSKIWQAVPLKYLMHSEIPRCKFRTFQCHTGCCCSRHPAHKGPSPAPAASSASLSPGLQDHLLVTSGHHFCRFFCLRQRDQEPLVPACQTWWAGTQCSHSPGLLPPLCSLLPGQTSPPSLQRHAQRQIKSQRHAKRQIKVPTNGKRMNPFGSETDSRP